MEGQSKKDREGSGRGRGVKKPPNLGKVLGRYLMKE